MNTTRSQKAGRGLEGAKETSFRRELLQLRHWQVLAERAGRGRLQRGAGTSDAKSRAANASLGARHPTRNFQQRSSTIQFAFWKDSSGGRKEGGHTGKMWGLEQGNPPLQWNEEPLASLFLGWGGEGVESGLQ